MTDDKVSRIMELVLCFSTAEYEFRKHLWAPDLWKKRGRVRRLLVEELRRS